MTDRYESRASTHADDCWSWGPGHYKCAVRKIECLEQYLKTLPANWHEDSGLATWFPITAEEIECLRTENARLREDAARYRWLRKGESDDVAVVRGLGAMDYGMSAVVYTYSEEIDGDDLDAAIDAAMAKEARND